MYIKKRKEKFEEKLPRKLNHTRIAASPHKPRIDWFSSEMCLNAYKDSSIKFTISSINLLTNLLLWNWLI